MSATNLESLLNRVGKRVFVEYFEQFRDSGLTNAEVVAMLPQEFTIKSRRSRTAKARRIIRDGLQAEALRVIAASERTETEAVARAELLLAKL